MSQPDIRSGCLGCGETQEIWNENNTSKPYRQDLGDFQSKCEHCGEFQHMKELPKEVV